MHHGCAGTRWSFPAKDDTATLGRQGPGKTISATGVFEMEPQERIFVLLLSLFSSSAGVYFVVSMNPWGCNIECERLILCNLS